MATTTTTHEAGLGLLVRGRCLFDKVRCGLHNETNGRLRLSGWAVASNDTEFTFRLRLETRRKATKAELEFARAFVRGVACGCDQSGQLFAE